MSCCCKHHEWPFRYSIPPYPVFPNYPKTAPAVYIRGKELDVWFAGILFERHIDGVLWQYDKGLKLNVRGLDVESVNEIQFARTDSTDGVVAYTPEVVDPLAEEESTEPTEPDDGEDGEETQTDTEEEINPEDLPYLSVAIPDDLLLEPGTIVAYCVYKTEEEYRTIKAIYLTVHERMKVKDPNEETDDACGCEERLAEMQAMIDELKDKVDALTPAP